MTGQSFSSGFGKGKSFAYRDGVMTQIGDLEEMQWRELVLALIERNGDKVKLEHLKVDARKVPGTAIAMDSTRAKTTVTYLVRAVSFFLPSSPSLCHSSNLGIAIVRS